MDLAGKDSESIGVDDLAPIDEFHTRGRDATLELVELAQLDGSERFLDVGAGLGGSARHIAHEHGCQVTGIDLTEEYVHVARTLTAMVGLDKGVHFQQASALELPFKDGSFDVVWTEHVQMNIADKQRFYAEIARVLRPGGCLVFHDVFQGLGAAPFYPVPWAEEASISHLATKEEALAAMQSAGLTGEVWHGKRDESLAFFKEVAARIEQAGPPPIGIHLLMGDNAKEKLRNYVRNLTEGRTAVAMGRMRKS